MSSSPKLEWVRQQTAPLLALASILGGILLGLLIRMTTRDEIEETGTLMVFLSLPGKLFLRLLSALALPLILPKLVAALGSMDADTGGKVLAKVLAFYALLNLAIECTGLAIFLAIEPGASVNLETKNQTEQTETLPLRFAMRDIVFNLVPESVFVAPFQRFQTSLVNGKEPGMRGKVGVNAVQLGKQVGPLEVDEANVLERQDPFDGERGEGQFEGKVVDGANVLGLVAAAAALGTAAALRKEEGRMVVEICSSLASLVSLLLETALRYLCPPGLLSLVATQVVTLKAPAEALSRLGWFVLTMVAGNLVLPLIFLPIVLAIVVRTNPITFFLNMSEALLVNFGTASSISTFPVTLTCLTKKNKLSPTLASFALSLGVLINICSYPLLGLLYIGSVEGSPLTSGQTVVAILLLPVLACGTSGIPQDSFMTILLMCGMFGLPTAKLTSILAVDWLLDRLDGLCKVLTDATGAAVICKLSESGEQTEDAENHPELN